MDQHSESSPDLVFTRQGAWIGLVAYVVFVLIIFGCLI